jgi:hypothetical protein
MIKEIKKVNSKTFAQITSLSQNTEFLASILQGEGFDQVYLCGKWFKTLKGAERWVTKKIS